MQSNNIDYKKMIAKIKSSRLLNVCLAALAIVMSLTAAALVMDTSYWLFAALCAVISVVVFSSLIYKNAFEARAAKNVAESAVYAALLSPAQKQKIKRHQIRRGQIFYFSLFIAAVMPGAAVLTVMYVLLDSTVYTLCLAVFALVSVVFVAMSMLYHWVRLSADNNVMLLSENGILLGKDVLSFNAKKKEALQLLKFKDYYYLKFVKPAFLGIKYVSDVIIPVDGVLRKGKTGAPDDEIVLALGMDDIYITEDKFYESRDYIGRDAGEQSAPENVRSENEEPKPGKKSKDLNRQLNKRIYHADKNVPADIEPGGSDRAEKKGLLE